MNRRIGVHSGIENIFGRNYDDIAAGISAGAGLDLPIMNFIKLSLEIRYNFDFTDNISRYGLGNYQYMKKRPKLIVNGKNFILNCTKDKNYV